MTRIIWCILAAAAVTAGYSQEPAGRLPATNMTEKSTFVYPEFRALELEATRLPVRPGVPGKAPFWNEFAKRFMYAPAFDFAQVDGAVAYRFTATDEAGKTHTFTADRPWAALSPVWNDIAVGAVDLKVEGIDQSGKATGTAGERSFYRLAIFGGPYRADRVKTNIEAGVDGLRGLLRSDRFQYWLTDGKPFPGERHNCYPSKEMGASLRGMIVLSKHTNDPKEAADALKVAQNIADYLICHLTVPAGNRMEYLPYVYWLDPDRTVNVPPSAQKRHDQTMLCEPVRAILGYLELYEACGERKYLDAAVRAARTFVKILRKDNTWPLMAERDSGMITEPKAVVPTWLMFMFNDLDKKFGYSEFRPVARICEQWIMDNPVNTFGWDAQFEDITLRPIYRNMSYEQASDMAWYLLDNYPEDKNKVELAEEILRFVEDQFVIWEKPKASWHTRFNLPGGVNNPNRHIDNWILPAVIEQYTFFVVCRATATVMKSFGKAYRVTGKEIYLAKAQSLAGTLVETQRVHGGGEIPTFPMVTENIIWTNNSCINAMNLIQLDIDVAGHK